MPEIPSLEEPLSDGHVRLRQAAERDIPEILIAYQDDPQMHERLGEMRPPSGAELGLLAEQADVERLAGNKIALTITEAGGDDCRGRVAVHHVDWEHARGELGIWIAAQFRGRGVARRALRLAAPWLFRSCGIERLQLLTEPENAAMVRAASAAGFVHEGTLRSYARQRHGRVDAVVLSVLPSDLER